MARMITRNITVLPYDEQWEKDFQAIRDEVEAALGDIALQVEHVGSTSVRGLSAKPIIDVDVVVEKDSVEQAIRLLEAISYIHQGDMGIPDREAFAYSGKEHLRTHHLYVCPEGSDELRRHLAFRDYLRSNPTAVREYSRIKEEAARLHPHDTEGYAKHKAPFIEKVYAELGL